MQPFLLQLQYLPLFQPVLEANQWGEGHHGPQARSTEEEAKTPMGKLTEEEATLVRMDLDSETWSATARKPRRRVSVCGRTRKRSGARKQ